jgi:hypothetical protein
MLSSSPGDTVRLLDGPEPKLFRVIEDDTLVQCYKTFYGRNLRIFILSPIFVLVLGNNFQPSLMFSRKDKAFLMGVPFRCSNLELTPGLTHKH